MSDIQTFDIIETNSVIFIQNGKNTFGSYYYDGVEGEKTHHQNWLKLKKIPTKITSKNPQKRINQRFEIKDPSMVSERIPACIPESEAGENKSYDEFVWYDKYKMFSSLYSHKEDLAPESFTEHEFKLNIICKIDRIEDYGDFSFTVFRTRWESEGTTNITKKSAQNYLIETIIFPDIILPSRPCYLSSKQSFDIVRFHVKTKLDPRYAKITSDYAFCFAVSKVISLSEEESYMCDVSRLKSKRPKYETKYRDTRDVKIFEMSHEEASYKGYTVFPGFKGSNQKDLEFKIQTFLDELMIKINTPMEDCPNCKGRGVLVAG